MQIIDEMFLHDLKKQFSNVNCKIYQLILQYVWVNDKTFKRGDDFRFSLINRNFRIYSFKAHIG